MMKAYYVEINPNPEQCIEIQSTLVATRKIRNFYLDVCKWRHRRRLKHMSAYDFSKYLNNHYIPANPDARHWIKSVASKAIKQSLINTDMAFKKFFDKSLSNGYPNKHKITPYGTYYLAGTVHVDRHRIRLPKLGWVRLKEFGYIPVGRNHISSAHVSRVGHKYFVSILVRDANCFVQYPRYAEVLDKSQTSEGIGLDLGLANTVFAPSGVKIKDVRKSKNLLKLNASLKRQQRKLSKKIKRSNNWYKQLNIVRRLYTRIANIKRDIKRKGILDIVKSNPEYITIENLNIKDLMKNRRIANAFQQVGLFYVIEWLIHKCNEYNVELRQVDRFYPSSKLCSNCNAEQDMPLHKRQYNCQHCHLSLDRDINAAINLKQASEYTLLVCPKGGIPAAMTTETA